jgi:hypothetical protein
MKNPNDPIGNRTRDLPACSAVAHPTAPPPAPPSINDIGIKKTLEFGALQYLFIAQHLPIG